MKQLAAVLTLAFLALPLPAFAASGLAGTYQCEGWNPGSATTAAADYKGSLVLMDDGNGVRASWITGDPNNPTKGLGIITNAGGKRLLSIGYNDGTDGGIAVYEVSADGKTLTGLWGPAGAGHEVNKR
ncbi:MAG: hypothetical protein JWM80_4273 [Cyanobacteria bacterium RYN_339]|nr:hypothetical protein [Cyanobacteria bacterium RYN_339]